MGESQYPNHAIPFHVGDVIWKARNWEPANGYVDRNAGNGAADLRPLGDPLQRQIDGLNEFKTKTRALIVVPDGGVLEFCGQLRVLGETPGSSLSQALDDTRANVLPRLTGRLSAHHTTRPALDLAGPGRLDFRGVLCRSLVETSQEFRRHISPFFNG